MFGGQSSDNHMKLYFIKTNKKQLLLRLLEKYRNLLCAIHGFPSISSMPRGVLCHVEDPTRESTYGDVVHPCVRYIEEGFEGHKWWMVYTPYYASNNEMENPRLCYSDTAEGELPVKWSFYCQIAETPEIGYNSDPTMLFHNGQLFIFWRECLTARTNLHDCHMLTIGCKIRGKHITYFTKPQMTENSLTTDREVSPNIIARNDMFRAYAIHVDWNPEYVYHIPNAIARSLYKYKLIYLMDSIGLSDLNKSHGVAIWDSTSLEQDFHYVSTIPFANSSKFNQPWHMDVFNDDLTNTGVYAVVLSRQRHGHICLARSEDGEKFYFFNKPLMTSKTAGLIGLYKPTAVQAGNNLYLFYTAIDKQDDNLHQLFVTSADWKELMTRMDYF